MIHVCFGLHDKDGNYSKYVGTAICSLLENTKEDISVHIIHDKTLTERNKEKFKQVVDCYKQHIYFYEIELNSNLQQLRAVKIFSIGTLFRLKMVDILPVHIEKIVYLDADIIVNMNIKGLWDNNLQNFAMAVCRDIGITVDSTSICKNGIVDCKNYFNAGVLLINLKKLRQKYSLFEESLRFFEEYPYCTLGDQDALNYIFSNDIIFLEERYNQFVWKEKENETAVQNKIYHFTSGQNRNQRIRDVNLDEFDELFYHYLLITPWKDDIFVHYSKRIIQKNQQIQWIRNLLKKVCNCKKIFFGASGKMHPLVIEYFIVNAADYYVDNNSALWGEKKQEVIIHNPEELMKEDKANIAIIVTTLRYTEVKLQLESYGFKENEQFFDGRKLLFEIEGFGS
jgi:Lipopolysaccharide biosynthesis proteins, LPS:glycosyltransferases